MISIIGNFNPQGAAMKSSPVPDTEERERTNYATPWNSVSRVKGRVD
jgi:hypothetical protein